MMYENVHGIGISLEIRVINSQDPQSSVEMMPVSFAENTDIKLQ